MSALVVNIGDTVEVRIFARGHTPSKHDRWHPMKVRKIVFEGKSNAARECYVSGKLSPLDSTERAAWVQARYIRLPAPPAANPSDPSDPSQPGESHQ